MKNTFVQIHYQFKDRTEMIAQGKFAGNDDIRKKMKELNISYPLPEGARWLICTEGSEFFVKSDK